MSAEATAGATTQTQRYSVCDPPHPGVGGMHLRHLDPLTKTSRGGSSPMSPPTWKHYKDFADVFSEEAFTHLPPRKVWDHAIELHPDAKLPRGRTFPLSPAKQKELDEFLREFGKRTNLPVEVSDQSPCVLCQEEGRLPLPSARLPEAE